MILNRSDFFFKIVNLIIRAAISTIFIEVSPKATNIPIKGLISKLILNIQKKSSNKAIRSALELLFPRKIVKKLVSKFVCNTTSSEKINNHKNVLLE